MKVKELIEKLKEVDEESEVVVCVNIDEGSIPQTIVSFDVLEDDVVGLYINMYQLTIDDVDKPIKEL